jgi:NTP pyrophosphatase (non-canonical NTP hydrolase)
MNIFTDSLMSGREQLPEKIESLGELTLALRDFANRRGWDRHHTPKNLLMALTGEIGELVEIFQWLSAEEAAQIMSEASQAEHVREEVADVLIYLVRLCDCLNIDLLEAAQKKILKNAVKYPVKYPSLPIDTPK